MVNQTSLTKLMPNPGYGASLPEGIDPTRLSPAQALSLSIEKEKYYSNLIGNIPSLQEDSGTQQNTQQTSKSPYNEQSYDEMFSNIQKSQGIPSGQDQQQNEDNAIPPIVQSILAPTEEPKQTPKINHDDEPYGFDKSDKMSMLGTMAVGVPKGMLDVGARVIQLLGKPLLDAASMELMPAATIPEIGAVISTEKKLADYYAGGANDDSFTNWYNRKVERSSLVQNAKHSHPIVEALSEIVGNTAAIAPLLEQLPFLGAAKATSSIARAVDDAVTNTAAKSIINSSKTALATKIARLIGQGAVISESNYDPENNHYISQPLIGVATALTLGFGGKLIASMARPVANAIVNLGKKYGIDLPSYVNLEKLTEWLPFGGYKKITKQRAAQLENAGNAVSGIITEQGNKAISTDLDSMINDANGRLIKSVPNADDKNDIQSQIEELNKTKDLVGTPEGYQRYFDHKIQQYDDIQNSITQTQVAKRNAETQEQISARNAEINNLQTKINNIVGVPIRMIEHGRQAVVDDLHGRINTLKGQLTNQDLDSFQISKIEKKINDLSGQLTNAGEPIGYDLYLSGKTRQSLQQARDNVSSLYNNVIDRMGNAPNVDTTRTQQVAKQINDEQNQLVLGLRASRLNQISSGLLGSNELKDELAKYGVDSTDKLTKTINFFLSGKGMASSDPLYKTLAPYLKDIGTILYREGYLGKPLDIQNTVDNLMNGKSFTYADFKRNISSLGTMLNSSLSPQNRDYIKMLYGSMKADLRDHVEKYGGKDTLSTLDTADKVYANRVAPFESSPLQPFRDDDHNVDNFTGKFFNPKNPIKASEMLKQMPMGEDKSKLAVKASLINTAVERANIDGFGINPIKFSNELQKLYSLHKIVFSSQEINAFKGYKTLVNYMEDLTKKYAKMDEEAVKQNSKINEEALKPKEYTQFSHGKASEFLGQLPTSNETKLAAKAAIVSKAKDSATEVGIGINTKEFADMLTELANKNKNLFSKDEIKKFSDYQSLTNYVNRISPKAVKAGTSKGIGTAENIPSKIWQEKRTLGAGALILGGSALTHGVASLSILFSAASFGQLINSNFGRNLLVKISKLGDKVAEDKMAPIVKDIYKYLALYPSIIGISKPKNNVNNENIGNQ
jgi:hypothetical protein